MKTKLFILCLLASPYCYAQKDTIGLNVPLKNNAIIYEGIVDVPGKTKQELFSNAKHWFVDLFKSANDVIQNSNADEGNITGKGLIPLTWKAFMTTAYWNNYLTISIDCKAGKYRYRLYNMTLTGSGQLNGIAAEQYMYKLLGQPNSSGAFNGQCVKILKSLNSGAAQLIASIKSSMQAKQDTF